MTVQLIVLDPASIEAVARRVVELLDARERQAAGGELVDAATLARLLGVSRATVYEHAERLGGLRLGDGGRPRLRFDVEEARAAWTGRIAGEKSEVLEAPTPLGAVRRRRQTAAQPDSGLLPVKGVGCAV